VACKAYGYTFFSKSSRFNADLRIYKAILFAQMKREVEANVQKYGNENPPNPAQIFTVPHGPSDGNIHMIQKVFKGSFEVCNERNGFTYMLTSCSSIFSSRPDPHLRS
jgi:hypothetical protein